MTDPKTEFENNIEKIKSKWHSQKEENDYVYKVFKEKLHEYRCRGGEQISLHIRRRESDIMPKSIVLDERQFKILDEILGGDVMYQYCLREDEKKEFENNIDAMNGSGCGKNQINSYVWGVILDYTKGSAPYFLREGSITKEMDSKNVPTIRRHAYKELREFYGPKIDDYCLAIAVSKEELESQINKMKSNGRTSKEINNFLYITLEERQLEDRGREWRKSHSSIFWSLILDSFYIKKEEETNMPILSSKQHQKLQEVFGSQINEYCIVNKEITHVGRYEASSSGAGISGGARGR